MDEIIIKAEEKKVKKVNKSKHFVQKNKNIISFLNTNLKFAVQ